MTHNDLLLLLIGSFLPNNLIAWLYKRLFKRRTHLRYESRFKLISPRRYYQLFESDPVTQYRYHKRMQKFWLFNFLPMTALITTDIWYSLQNGINMQALITAALLALNTVYSLYANFDTETGDAHAAYASIKANEIQQAQTAPDTVIIDTSLLPSAD